MEKILRFAKRILPKKIFNFFQPAYHYVLAILGVSVHRSPSRHIKVVAVTGTKGKSSVVELTNAILEGAGYKTSALSTIRFKIGDDSRPNLYKMTTPGRFFVQKFLRQAVNAKCDYAVIEMTSEAARQFRHKFIDFDALIFTNLSPEHIESHGSYEKYVEAKLSIGRALEKSNKKDKVLVVNADEKESGRFLKLSIPNKLTYGIGDVSNYVALEGNILFTFDGRKINPKLEGIFNIYNCLAAATFAKSQGISTEIIKRGLEKVSLIKGRVEHVELDPNNPAHDKQNFTVIVDYAHTPDSLEKLYLAFPTRRKIAVLGNTGGGRDTWKRPVMASIAEKYCDEIILTNEDPYDEDPRKILEEMAEGMKVKKPEIIFDRREAIATALRNAKAIQDTLNPASATEAGSGTRYQNVAVLITGKGTDPYIMGSNGSKLIWDDATVVREELAKILL